ncbi:amidohydrolase family protein [Sphingomonas profundi]|uniref:amidohydrolase family protein n=1 Tax=Alterirhizorhabdus profundi TaxID=2681549 RepID=UPI001E62D4DF|nr:amidohydrolase family protein [Sphingomonas profundi]
MNKPMERSKNYATNRENEWRLKAPAVEGWQRSVRPGADKYFIVSCDTHLMPPVTLFRDRLDKQWHDQLPRVEKRDDGERYIVMPGARAERLIDFKFEGEDLLRSKAGGDSMAIAGEGSEVSLQRIADQDMDGVDAEVIFPNGPALLMWSSSNDAFVSAQCAVWNDWAWEVCGPYSDRCSPAAALNTADIEGAIAEVQRVAKMGYRVLTLPCKPIWGEHDVSHINYNLPVFDPLWAAIQDADLAITYHVSTGKDPRAARGNGGAIINYVVHSLAPTMEPIVSMCASGVFERFPRLRVATIEADAGFVPWMLQKMDEAYLKHHFWVRPKMKALPSDYYRSNCYASFGEDRAALELIESFDLGDNFMWANDYPHHEGSWPHSAEAIERTFGDGVKEETRAKLLGLNAARCFRFDIPQKYRD